uniref:CXXC-type zinc finger protein 1 n=1 Tax=Steinernema glaseri TaxID=37863 RepID=A0A1I7YJE2_9BILA
MAEVAKLRAMKSKQRQEEKMKTEKKTYCLCESTDDQRFMIQCDECQMWYHCDCMNITRTMAKKIEHYYCPKCISKDANLAIVYKHKVEPKKKDVAVKERHRETVKSYTYDYYAGAPSHDYDAKRCNHCAGCLRLSDCQKCENCATRRSPCLRRICMKTTISSESEPELSDKDDEAYVLPSGSQPKHDSKPTPGKRGRKKGWRKNQADATPKPVKVPGKRGRPCKTVPPVQQEVISYFVPPPLSTFVPPADAAEECWGPQCGEMRRPSSKYCSDECGIALAELRLRKYLPGLIDEYWRNPPLNYIEAEKRIKEIDEEGDRLKLKIKDLTEYAEILDEWNRTLQQMPVDEDYEPPSTGDDFVFPCQMCSADVSVKGLIKHLERCFIRVEKQMSFGSAAKYPQNPHNIFCEEYNKTNNTYCKRLRIGCPEHYKPTKDDEDVICGCPKIWWSVPSLSVDDLFVSREQLLADGYCRDNRKHCDAHRRWDQYASALIDVERARNLYRADELVEQRRLVTIEQNHRGCVVELMTNFTKKVDSDDFSDLTQKPEGNDSQDRSLFRAPYPVGESSTHSHKSGGRGSSKRKGSPGIKTYIQGSEYNEDEVYFVGTLNNDDS